MSSIFKGIRSSLVVGAVWGGAATVLSSAVDFFRIGSVGLERLAQNAVEFGIAGFVGGVLFSLLLVLGERRRDRGGVSVGRGAVWGFLGGLVMPLIMMVILNPGFDLGAGLAIMLENWSSSLLPWATLGGLFGAATAAIAASDPIEEGPREASRMVGAPRPESALDAELTDASQVRPQEML